MFIIFLILKVTHTHTTLYFFLPYHTAEYIGGNTAFIVLPEDILSH